MSPRPSHGRTVTLLVLTFLLLTVCATVYLSLSRWAHPVATTDLTEEQLHVAEMRRFAMLLSILLMSALLILLFVVGAYLLINVGRVVGRERVGGKPTEYVDIWGKYRLTEEQISAATAEDDRDNPHRRRPPPESPPDGERPTAPPEDSPPTPPAEP